MGTRGKSIFSYGLGSCIYAQKILISYLSSNRRTVSTNMRVSKYLHGFKVNRKSKAEVGVHVGLLGWIRDGRHIR